MQEYRLQVYVMSEIPYVYRIGNNEMTELKDFNVFQDRITFSYFNSMHNCSKVVLKGN